jgi:hypothetical protein
MCGLRIGSFTLTPAVIIQLTCVELFGGSMKWDKKESSFVSQILSSFSKLQNISRGGLLPLSFTFMVGFLILGSRMLDLGILNGM